MTKLAIPTLLEKRESSRALKGIQQIFAGPNNAACLTETEALVWGTCTSGCVQHSFALRLISNHVVMFCFFCSQLGNGGTEDRTPTPLPLEIPEHTIVQIAFGQNFGVALTSSGAVFTWGGNGSGQLGALCARLCCLHHSDFSCRPR